MAVIVSRKIVLPISPYVPVTISGQTRNTNYHYAKINGTKYTAAATGIEVRKGTVIVFGVCGSPAHSNGTGTLTIDGTTVYSATSSADGNTYEWTVPRNISAITIKMTYGNDTGSSYGSITVTTTAA